LRNLAFHAQKDGLAVYSGTDPAVRSIVSAIAIFIASNEAAIASQKRE